VRELSVLTIKSMYFGSRFSFLVSARDLLVDMIEFVFDSSLGKTFALCY